MAKSSSSVFGFSLARSLFGVNNPGSLDYIITNSSTIAIGDLVRLDTNGFVKRCAAGEPVLGIAIGLIDKNGINIFSPRAAGITGATLTPDDTLAVSSTNQTDATRQLKVQVVLDPAGQCVWRNTVDIALAQTNLGQTFNMGTNAGQISQATASDTTSKQMQLVALDDVSATVGYFRISLCQLVIGQDEASTKIAA